ncbi:hypothetical protein QMK19_17895 [Streptomyces sp. H10-C2]|uniref:hypothetical protein n=1 Tax=unclassified Streptomyces TaxID=2593676 RepID=UPI0024BB97AF|nr:MULTISPECIES: hypothetical protein [unclassified Streptomyces]MDJ0343425.1 hypothetical protein [Streptomyces sp. PH10-H1]MDJ0371505.1 hypothetical protein [Streptomyces sp. H10-C2]
MRNRNAVPELGTLTPPSQSLSELVVRLTGCALPWRIRTRWGGEPAFSYSSRRRAAKTYRPVGVLIA